MSQNLKDEKEPAMQIAEGAVLPMKEWQTQMAEGGESYCVCGGQHGYSKVSKGEMGQLGLGSSGRALRVMVRSLPFLQQS